MRNWSRPVELTAAFHYTRSAAFLVDATGVVTDFNAACRELLGLNAAGCRGKHYSQLIVSPRPHMEGELLPSGALRLPIWLRRARKPRCGTSFSTRRI